MVKICSGATFPSLILLRISSKLADFGHPVEPFTYGAGELLFGH